MTTTAWPFGFDADEHDPLTKLRIAVTGSHPGWYYLVAFDRDSDDRPTGAEAAMLASCLDEYKTYWYAGGSYAQKLAERALDVDGGANGTIFRKWGDNDWGYRKQTWTMGPMFVPQSPRIRERYPDEAPLGPLTLAQLMDHIHAHGDDQPCRRWLDWKAAHPEVFPT